MNEDMPFIQTAASEIAVILETGTGGFWLSRKIRRKGTIIKPPPAPIKAPQVPDTIPIANNIIIQLKSTNFIWDTFASNNMMVPYEVGDKVDIVYSFSLRGANMNTGMNLNIQDIRHSKVS